MRSLAKKFISTLTRWKGPTWFECAVMLALIIVVDIAAVSTLGSNASSTFSNARKESTAVGDPNRPQPAKATRTGVSHRTQPSSNENQTGGVSGAVKPDKHD